MSIIVFDLETTDLYSCGQILNYCFMQIENLNTWKVHSSLFGEIELEPHQLPSADAILTNKINIKNHTQGLCDSEFVAMSKIHKYIQNIVENDPQVTILVGHNIAKFDLNYLRTSMIRNGFNPYFGRNLCFADTIHLSKKYASLNPSAVPTNFKLTTLCKEWLNESCENAHHSHDDVLSTINLLKFLHTSGVNVTYQTYERPKYFRKNNLDQIVACELPVINMIYFQDGKLLERPILKISENGTYALWLDLTSDYEKEGRKSVLWFKKDLSSLIVSKCLVSVESAELADKAQNFVNSHDEPYYNIQTFFEKPLCDIENHIYMLPFHEIGILEKLIHSDRNMDLLENTSTYCSQLYLRHLMKQSGHKPILQKYVNSRYVNKTFIVGKDNKNETHWTLSEMYNKIKTQNIQEPYIDSLISCYQNFAITFDISLN